MTPLNTINSEGNPLMENPEGTQKNNTGTEKSQNYNEKVANIENKIDARIKALSADVNKLSETSSTDADSNLKEKEIEEITEKVISHAKIKKRLITGLFITAAIVVAAITAAVTLALIAGVILTPIALTAGVLGLGAGAGILIGSYLSLAVFPLAGVVSSIALSYGAAYNILGVCSPKLNRISVISRDENTKNKLTKIAKKIPKDHKAEVKKLFSDEELYKLIKQKKRLQK